MISERKEKKEGRRTNDNALRVSNDCIRRARHRLEQRVDLGATEELLDGQVLVERLHDLGEEELVRPLERVRLAHGGETGLEELEAAEEREKLAKEW